jgi:hypothetical protein
MGAWGVGLYSNDMALDLKSTVASVLRLPLSPDEALAILIESEPALSDAADEDYTDAWFVVADRFHRYGVRHEPTVQLVYRLIDDGTDLRVKSELGLEAPDLRARGKVLAQLRDRLAAPHEKPFKTATLKKPQEFVLDVGDLLAYPTMDGDSANPYFKDWASARFTPNGYGAALIAERGRTFGYLAWYSVTVLDATWSSLPSLKDCLKQRVGDLDVGTLSKTHLSRMALTSIAAVEVVSLPERTWSAEHPESAAISDISVANRLRRPRDISRKSPRLKSIVRV